MLFFKLHGQLCTVYVYCIRKGVKTDQKSRDGVGGPGNKKRFLLNIFLEATVAPCENFALNKCFSEVWYFVLNKIYFSQDFIVT